MRRRMENSYSSLQSNATEIISISFGVRRQVAAFSQAKAYFANSKAARGPALQNKWSHSYATRYSGRWLTEKESASKLRFMSKRER